MNSLSQYILEKFKISKDISNNSAYIDEILKLCDIPEDNEKIVNLITNWINNDKDKFTSLRKISNIEYIKKSGIYNDFSYIEKFEDDSSLAKKLLETLIIDGRGKEVFTGNWIDPKIYYNNDVLIYHDFRDIRGKSYNIDKIFIKIRK